MGNKLTERLVTSMPWLDAVSERMSKLYDPFLGPNASAAIKDALYGVRTGHPLHPAIVDLPIGAWSSSLLLDAVGMEEAADLTLKVGTVSALAAALTGAAQWQDTQGMEHPRRLGTLHAMLNVAATGLYGASWLCRDRGYRSTGISLSTVGYGLATFSAWLGGDLAYDLGIGVNRTAFDEPSDDWTEVAREDELVDGKPTRVDAAGVPVLLVKQAGALYAITATCTHVGGPLDEGEIGDCTVTCPWHGSVFDLRDASVIHGPATGAGAAYDVRVHAGTISIRSRG
ncbi:MAG: Rieske 2Fe-2S domain-containing protein [Chloroflexia bacterium]|nr:Rieske 2Fe-2S domain-containing protein [Chloroflexia bacterium]